MTKVPKNIGASVRARLLKLAKERGEDFQLLLSRYVNERLLHRLSVSDHSSQFVLKGAALFTLWTGRAHRATRDLGRIVFECIAVFFRVAEHLSEINRKTKE